MAGVLPPIQTTPHSHILVRQTLTSEEHAVELDGIRRACLGELHETPEDVHLTDSGHVTGDRDVCGGDIDPMKSPLRSPPVYIYIGLK